MTRYRTVGQVEADLMALRVAAERAGTALACLFSCSDEFEAAVIRARRRDGAFAPQRKPRRRLRPALTTAVLAATFLMM